MKPATPFEGLIWFNTYNNITMIYYHGQWKLFKDHMMTTKILSNQVLCRRCGDTPYSRGRNSMVDCRCGNVSVDGGQSYLRRAYATDEWDDISIEWSMAKYDKMTILLHPIWTSLIVDNLPGGSSLEYDNPIVIKIENISIKPPMDRKVEIARLYIEERNLDIDRLDVYLKAVEWAFDTGRNTLGLICALARTERDGDFYVE